jgi:hypothetical protein
MKKLSFGPIALLALLVACSGSRTSGPPLLPPERPEGQSEFETPTQGGGTAYDRAGGAAPGAPTAEAGDNRGPTAAPAEQPPERLIEESDIYKLVGTKLFVLNRYRGLQVIELSDLDRPKVIGRAPIFGYPKEMYVRGTNAYVIVSDYYTFWRDELAAADVAPRAFYGSQVRVVDVSDPTRLRVTGGFNLLGDAVDSRIVGNVMYVAAQHYPWYYRFDSTDTEDKTTITSINIADPANVTLVEQEDFPRNGWEHHIAVTPDTIYVASSGWENGYGTTHIRYVDISDPDGQIVIRGGTTAPGRVQDRWSMDEHQGILRVASGQSWGNGDVYLTTYDVTNPDAITRKGGYTLHVNEQLTSARFDGPNAYLVSYRNIDPLFHFDLSDPARPRFVGELEMTGWLDFMVPMENRIVALGHEDVTTPEGRQISLAVSLIGVSPNAAPRLLSRVTVGEGWGSVPGQRDDFAKIFKVLRELGLVVFPFQSWSRFDYRYEGGVQLIDLDLEADKLTKRGLIENAGWVERGIPHGPSNVLTLSSEIFQVLDIANRDRPRLRGRLELARNVQGFAPLTDAHAVQLSGDWYMGDTNLTVTPLLDPDAATPTGQAHLPAQYGRMFVNPPYAYVASREELRSGDQVTGYTTRIQIWDLSDPAAPRARGSVRLPEEVWVSYGYWYWGSGDEVVQVNGTTLAFHRYNYYYYPFYDCLDCGRPAAQPGANTQKLYVVDLANPDSPRLASTVSLDGANWAWGLKASGDMLYLSEYQTVQRENQWYQRYFVRRINVREPGNPVVHPGVNIPGMLVDASADGRYFYTLETWWDQAGSRQRNFFHALALVGDRAYLRSRVELEGYVNSVLVKGSAAFASTQWWEAVAGSPYGGQSHTALVTVDLSNPRAIRVAGKAEVPYDWAYLQAVEGGRAFLGSGAGVFTYLVGDVAQPTFEQFFRTQGWSSSIVVRGDVAFVPSGYYGVQVLRLGTGQGL